VTSLFDRCQLGDLVLPNRIVMAPMTRVRATADGRATPSMSTYYAQRATTGLIVTEGVHPNRVGQSNPLARPGRRPDQLRPGLHRQSRPGRTASRAASDRPGRRRHLVPGRRHRLHRLPRLPVRSLTDDRARRREAVRRWPGPVDRRNRPGLGDDLPGPPTVPAYAGKAGNVRALCAGRPVPGGSVVRPRSRSLRCARASAVIGKSAALPSPICAWFSSTNPRVSCS
jgi:hypothetical protein